MIRCLCSRSSGIAKLQEDLPMNSKSLIAALAIAAGVAGISPIVQADDPTAKNRPAGG